jgi:spermidine/putrescine transport system ATP-binding protein
VQTKSSDAYEIELIGVSKVFKEVVAVDEVNIRIKQGEFFSLLGPSGCGKTTTLRMIAGLETPSSGEILIEQEDVTDVPAYHRDVNTVFQDYAIFPHMNVYENIYYPLRMKKISRKDAHDKILNILKLVNMDGFEHRFSNQLSGGQRQRIALARALVNEPKALLLDEPLGALDFKLRVAMQSALKELQTKLSMTFVYVTHDQTEAITMSDRIAVMNNGKVHQIGTPDEIYNNPSTAFVASFIGEMNFMEGVVLRRNADTIEVVVLDKKIIC